MKAFNPSVKRRQSRLFIFSIVVMTFVFENSLAQDRTTYMRIAKVTVDSTSLDAYKAALKEQMQAALTLEKGVLAYSALQDKNDPTKITILETYASVAAYQAHIQTVHFKKYKTTVADMVKQLELTEVIPFAVQSKPK